MRAPCTRIATLGCGKTTTTKRNVCHFTLSVKWPHWADIWLHPSTASGWAVSRNLEIFFLAEFVEVQSIALETHQAGKTAVDGASLTWNAFKGVSTCLLSESQTVPAKDGFHGKTVCFSVQHKGRRHRNEFRIVLIRHSGSDMGQRGRGWCGQQKGLQGSRDARLWGSETVCKLRIDSVVYLRFVF